MPGVYILKIQRKNFNLKFEIQYIQNSNPGNLRGELSHRVISVAVTFEGVLGGAELVACVAVVAGGHVGQVLGLDMALDGAVVLGAVAAHRALQGAVCQPARPHTTHKHFS
jgi:hypothetical protein